MLKPFRLVCIFVACLQPWHVQGHGNMVWPYTWFDLGGQYGMQPGTQCIAGSLIPAMNGLGVSCLWFTNNTFTAGEPTLDPSLRTYRDIFVPGFGSIDVFTTNPWRSPGSAHIDSPCGVGGGNINGCPPGGPHGEGMDCPGGGYSYGQKAEDLVESWPDVVTTEWQIGSTVEAAWGILANHGGGYSYRLCKVPEEGYAALTEECFQQTPLAFASDMQWVQYGEFEDTRVEFKANRTKDGTFPAGSEWTKNPIPACYPNGGYFDYTCDDPQFPPPAPGLLGFGETVEAPGVATFLFSIVDQLIVPEDLSPGEYVLSFRWDCEQTPQIWNTCSSIILV